MSIAGLVRQACSLRHGSALVLVGRRGHTTQSLALVGAATRGALFEEVALPPFPADRRFE